MCQFILFPLSVALRQQYEHNLYVADRSFAFLMPSWQIRPSLWQGHVFFIYAVFSNLISVMELGLSEPSTWKQCLTSFCEKFQGEPAMRYLAVDSNPILWIQKAVPYPINKAALAWIGEVSGVLSAQHIPVIALYLWQIRFWGNSKAFPWHGGWNGWGWKEFKM